MTSQRSEQVAAYGLAVLRSLLMERVAAEYGPRVSKKARRKMLRALDKGWNRVEQMRRGLAGGSQ